MRKHALSFSDGFTKSVWYARHTRSRKPSKTAGKKPTVSTTKYQEAIMFDTDSRQQEELMAELEIADQLAREAELEKYPGIAAALQAHMGSA